MRKLAHIPMHREGLDTTGRPILSAGTLSASLFRYPSGIDALRLRDGRGEMIILPWFGQMIWSARFDGVDLAMSSGFDMPREASSIAGTYGCLLFHSGLLRNGVPAPGDDHQAHGEFPTAPLQRAWLELLEDDTGLALRVCGERDHVVGFGAHYVARPTVTLHEKSAMFTVALDVVNRSGKPMDLMYMAHANFAFVPDGRIVQAAPYTPEQVVVRRAVPAHVQPTQAYLDLIEALAHDPGRMETLHEPALYDPEQVFYVRRLATDADGLTGMLLRRPQGDAFSMRWRPAEFPHCVRWILDDPDQKIAAFALPSTCEPEGYAAELRKGHVRSLPPGGQASFRLEAGYLDCPEADAAETRIIGLNQAREASP